MSLARIFAPLLHALTGGRYPSGPSRRKRTDPLDDDWYFQLALLGLPPHALHDAQSSGSLHPHFHYRHFNKPKKAGGLRQLSAPDEKLKHLQQYIIQMYFSSVQPHPAAIAYREKKSIADHVWAHAGAEIILTADIQDFFPNTAAWRVEQWWQGRVKEDLADLLTLLTTYRGGLPQGAPTSPGLSNFVNVGLDTQLTSLADATGAKYTRYCDDMVFSWHEAFGPTADFAANLCTTLGAFGYTLHPQKGVRGYHRRDEPEITGLILTRNGGVRLPTAMHQKMKALARSNDPLDAQRLAGYQGYEAMVQPKHRRKKKAHKRSTHRRMQPLRKIWQTVRSLPKIWPRPTVEDGEDDIPF